VEAGVDPAFVDHLELAGRGLAFEDELDLVGGDDDLVGAEADRAGDPADVGEVLLGRDGGALELDVEDAEVAVGFDRGVARGGDRVLQHDVLDDEERPLPLLQDEADGDDVLAVGEAAVDVLVDGLVDPAVVVLGEVEGADVRHGVGSFASGSAGGSANANAA
jgi:hypothetical protein